MLRVGTFPIWRLTTLNRVGELQQFASPALCALLGLLHGYASICCRSPAQHRNTTRPTSALNHIVWHTSLAGPKAPRSKQP